MDLRAASYTPAEVPPCPAPDTPGCAQAPSIRRARQAAAPLRCVFAGFGACDFIFGSQKCAARANPLAAAFGFLRADRWASRAARAVLGALSLARLAAGLLRRPSV